MPQWKRTYLAAIGAGILISVGLIASAAALQEPLRGVVAALGAALLGVAAVGLVFDLLLRAEYLSRFRLLLDQDTFGIQAVLGSASQIPFVEKLAAAHAVSIMGLAMGRLATQEVLDILRQKAEHGFRVRLLVADPQGAAVHLRYEKDEPPYFEAGQAGIQRRLDTLWQLRQSLASQHQTNLDVRLFSNYPALSIAIFDQDLYVYPYGYGVRGIEAPVFHFYGLTRRGGAFFAEQFERVYRDAVPLGERRAA